MPDGLNSIDTATYDSATGITPVTGPTQMQRRRKKLLLALAGTVAIAAFSGGAYLTVIGERYVSTDNAYVGASTAQINSQIAGTIADIRVEDTQVVHRGDVLAVIDPADANLAVARASAEYRRTLQRVRQYYAQESAAAAQVHARQADLERAETEYVRRRELAATGAVSGEEVTGKRAAYDAARANLATAQETLEAQRALTQGGGVTDHPETVAAQAALDTARLELSRTTIRAPVDGVVAQKRLQVGQRVQPGQSLMVVTPLAQAYVDANFKEGQLGEVRVGQPVELTSDLYGDDVIYHGRVAGLGGGTGAAFAVIPAQNATGNWIKVVQRVPVRIELSATEIAARPLRVGLSMNATIDTHAVVR